jgi:hypothetical protein
MVRVPRTPIEPWQEYFAVHEPQQLPATIAEGLDPGLLDRRWRPRDDRGRFVSPRQVLEEEARLRASPKISGA